MGSVHIEDRQSGRIAVVRQPLGDYLSPKDIIELEKTAYRWGNFVEQANTEKELIQLANGRPEQVFYGLLWMTGVWCSLASARFDVPIQEFINGLEYKGVRRELSGIPDNLWKVPTDLVRQGISFVVGNDDYTREYLGAIKVLDPTFGKLRPHLLMLMDGLSQHMSRNGLVLWGMCRKIITEADWTDQPQ